MDSPSISHITNGFWAIEIPKGSIQRLVKEHFWGFTAERQIFMCA